MLTCKFGNWWELNPQRGRANNSAVVLRHKIKKPEFMELWKKIEASGSGEPGIYFSNNAEFGTNPCCEIALRPNGFCNLTEINMSDIQDQDDLEARARAASFLGTIQAGYTDFHYLRDEWRRTAERDSLIGVSGTGIASKAFENCDLELASKAVVDENKRVAAIIGINPAARTTCIKPAGTTSLVLGTSSGIHAWYAPYYIRRIRLGKNEALYGYVKKHLPDLVEDCFFKPDIEAVLSIPIKAPAKGIFRDETAIDLLERVKLFSEKWVKTGHIKGDNTHNVSATISVKDEEWKEVGEWMWKNRDSYNGLAVLPYDGGTYKQAPFEEISKSKYYSMEKQMKKLDLTKVSEEDDNTDLSGEVACAGGVCDL
jgi:ribonucleoside-diphosphate reductase alpha chain